MNKKKKLPDFINTHGVVLIVLLLLLSFFLYFYANSYNVKAYSYTLLMPNGKKTTIQAQVKPLHIKGKLGNVIIEWNDKGMVRIASSTCPNKICVRTGWIGANNATVCVPNLIAVECHGNSVSEFDGISR